MSRNKLVFRVCYLTLCCLFGILIGKAIATTYERTMPSAPPTACSPSASDGSCKFDQYDPCLNPTPSGATAKVKLQCGGGNTGCNFCLDLYGLRYESTDGTNFTLAPGTDQLSPAFNPASYPMNCISTQTVTNSVTFSLGPWDPNSTYYRLKLIMRVYFTPCPPIYSGPPDSAYSEQSPVFSC